MPITIPTYLRGVLSRDTSAQGYVDLSIAAFAPWIERNDLAFFPEYTDHGPQHLSDVLATAEGLLSDGARERITPGDAATLILAILLHDVAMHLTEDSFIVLVQSETEPPVEGFRDEKWPKIWGDFVREASRFDERRWKSMFGDPTPVEAPGLTNPMNWTGKQRVLVGEFLRRHHPRLAHEIALGGVPGPDGARIRLNPSVPESVADLAGLVARSHGLSIRRCLPYLEERYDLREYAGIHPVYLMTLLRVADYLQIQAERAPRPVLAVKKLHSPISQGEWRVHDCVRDIRRARLDPEAIFIDALPPDAATYLRIKEWLAGIQSELDASWAVLGEIYGRFKDEELDKLGLRLRRITSTLDDEEAFARRRDIHYVPMRAEFRTANADLLKLLIGPLYGDRPEIGVRELLANAVDAVRELWAYQEQRPDLKNVDLTEQEADVVVALETDADGSRWLSVSDRGIGMTAEIIRDYFLTAGASFRNSEAWWKRFTDESGNPTVLRCGRFGVGAFAAFLLGDEMHVTTRHADARENEAIVFRASLDTNLIELKRAARPVGTTVRIRLDDDTSATPRGLQFGGWYCLEKPSVAWMDRNDGSIYPQEHTVPEDRETLLPKWPDWRRIEVEDYEDVQWSFPEYLDAWKMPLNGIIHNGFLIDLEEQNITQDPFSSEDVHISMPTISIFDRKNKLPLNLQRTGLMQDPLSFQDAIVHDVIKDFLAFALVNSPEHPLTHLHPSIRHADEHYQGFDYSELSMREVSVSPWFSNQKGASFCDSWNILKMVSNSLLVIHSNMHFVSSKYHMFPSLRAGDGQIVFHIASVEENYPQMARYVFGLFEHIYFPLNSAHIQSRRILIHRSMINYCAPEGFYVGTTTRRSQEKLTENWSLYSIGECPPSQTDFKSIAKEMEREPDPIEVEDKNWWHIIVTECYLAKEQLKPPLSPITKAWRDIIGTPIIPFDQTERRRKLAHAFETLAPYVEVHKIQKRLRDEARQQIEGQRIKSNRNQTSQF